MPFYAFHFLHSDHLPATKKKEAATPDLIRSGY
nr:MAG TPA: hypothetical protein [Bacteriophage sp.]